MTKLVCFLSQLLLVSGLLAPLPVFPFAVDPLAYAPFIGNLSIGDTLLEAGDPIHENITRDAMKLVIPDISHRLIRHIQSGNVNADSPADHKFDHIFHVNNATAHNGRFAQSFGLIQDFLNQAVAQARDNPAVLNPMHNTFRGLAADVASSLTELGLNLQCGGLGLLTESACPKAQLFASAAAIAAFELVNPSSPVRFPMPDPHGLNKPSVDQIRDTLNNLLDPPQKYCAPLDGNRCFFRLDDMLKDNEDFQRGVRHLRKLKQQARAYYAWQYLGHAMHTTQDFFAHSNFIELINDQPGPPCGAISLPYCGQPISNQVESYQSERLQPFIDKLRQGFALNVETLQETLGNRFLQLQTGFVDLQSTADIGLKAASKYCPAALPGEFQYCHWPKDYVPGLDKDSDDKVDEYPAHHNHRAAKHAATQVSAELWRTFLIRAGFQVLTPDPLRKDRLLEAIRQVRLQRTIAVILDDDE